MKRYKCTVPDYEHSGDIDYQISEIKKVCPEATNIHGYEVEDSEAEYDYEDEYGELDEPIYQGYVEFDAPESYSDVLAEIDCY